MNPQTLDRLDALHARLYRWRWWVRVAVMAAVLPWAYCTVLPRIHGMPARPATPQNAGPPDTGPCTQPDLTLELADIMQSLPISPTVMAPKRAPIGKQWVTTAWPASRISALQADDLRDSYQGPFMRDSTAEVLCGEWLPQTRYALSLAVAYLRDPTVQESIARIHLAVDRHAGPRQLQRPEVLTDVRVRPDVLSGVRVLLAAQGRYHIAAEHDVKAAGEEIRVILRLAAGCEAAGNLAGLNQSLDLRKEALREMMHWSREVALSREQADQLVAVLDRGRLDLRSRWKEVVRGEQVRLEEGLDDSYTRDGQGNGWYVIHRPDPAVPLDNAYCLLNVASLWMTDRAGMVGKIREFTQKAAERIDLPYDAGLRQIASIETGEVCSSPVDGPHVQWTGGSGMRSTLWGGVACLQEEVAVRTGLALSVYRHDHGSYPARLEDLVPAYLPEVSMDPEGNRPLKCEPDAKDGYQLYAVVRRALPGHLEMLDADLQLLGSRPGPSVEFYLRPLTDWVVIQGEGGDP